MLTGAPSPTEEGYRRTQNEVAEEVRVPVGTDRPPSTVRNKGIPVSENFSPFLVINRQSEVAPIQYSLRRSLGLVTVK